VKLTYEIDLRKVRQIQYDLSGIPLEQFEYLSGLSSTFHTAYLAVQLTLDKDGDGDFSVLFGVQEIAKVDIRKWDVSEVRSVLPTVHNLIRITNHFRL
jgi:hypothetical protein